MRLFRNWTQSLRRKLQDETKMNSQISSLLVICKFNHPIPVLLAYALALCVCASCCTTVCLCLRCSSPALCVFCAYCSVFVRKLRQKVSSRRKQAFSNTCRERARQDGVKACREFAWHAACISWPILSCRIKSKTT